MGKYLVTYVDNMERQIIVEAESKEKASYKLPPWDPRKGSRRIISIEPFIEKYIITYEHGDRYERRIDTITVMANSIDEARKKVPYTPGDEFSYITNITLVSESEKNYNGQEK